MDRWASGRDHTIERWLHVIPDCVVVCSTNCLQHVEALLQLGDKWKYVNVVRGTHSASDVLIYKIHQKAKNYAEKNKHKRQRLEYPPGLWDAVIDEWDVPMGELKEKLEGEQDYDPMWEYHEM